MTDIVSFGEATLRLRTPRGRQLTRTGAFDAAVGGPECNAAVTASELGADAVWLSRLPDSPLGRRVVAELRSHGVRTGVSWGDDGEPLATAFVDAGVEPRGRTELRHDRDSAFTGVKAGNLPLSVVRNADYLHLTGVTVARSKRAASAGATLLETAAEADTTATFDLRYREQDWSRAEARSAAESLFPHVDVLFATLDEAGTVFEEEGDPVEVAHAIRTGYEFETVVLTHGEGGALAVHDDEVHEADPVEADVVDDAGAADAFVGGFLAKRADGGAVKEALAWATAASALATTLEGDAVDVPRERVVALAARDENQ
jgi:2-dehydro-3-deoxygluconokinase